MQWKNIGMGKKLGIGFGFVILLLLGISTISQTGFKQLAAAIDESVYFNQLQTIMLQREIDHMNWQNKVIIFLLSDTTEPLKVEMDDRTCKLGKWLYGEGREKAEKMLPQLKPLLKELEKPHYALHQSAKEIQQSVTRNNGDRDEAFQIYNTKTRTALKQIKSGLHSVADVVSEHVQTNNLQLQSDATFKSRLTIACSLIAVVLALLFSFFLARLITTTLNKAVSMADSLADGDLTTRLDIVQKDEFGQLATALNSMSDRLNQMIGSMSNDVMGLSSNSNELNMIAQSMGENSNTVSDRANIVAASTQELSGNMQSVAAASEEASTNVSIVAAASEEVTNSISEVDTKTSEARVITEDAVALAGSATVKVDALGEAASKINKVTQVITDISEQTNLLALNATIEAARAGEAGKGFAVVANEIKELAKQTADATGEIRSSIEAMQGSTNETVDEIRQITDVITRVDEIVAAIAGAVSEQSATTIEITENITQAAMGIGEVNENVAQSSASSAEIADSIEEVHSMTEELSTTSRDVEDTAKDLGKTVLGLKKMIEQFKINRQGNSRSSIPQNSSSSGRDLIHWNSSVQINIREIDKQHRKLIDLINDLHRAMKSGSGSQQAGTILNQLVDYTSTHFSYEEGLLQKCDYPDITAHKERHKKLVAQIVDFQRKFQEGNSTISVEIMDFLKSWLVDHIKGVDTKYVACLQEHGIR